MSFIYVLSENKEKNPKVLTENCHFYTHEDSQYIAWVCLRNENILSAD